MQRPTGGESDAFGALVLEVLASLESLGAGGGGVFVTLPCASVDSKSRGFAVRFSQRCFIICRKQNLARSRGLNRIRCCYHPSDQDQKDVKK